MMSSIKTDIGSYQIDLNSFVKEGSADKDINDFDKLTDRDGNHLFIWTYDSVPYYPMPYIMETVPRMSNFPTRKNDVFICAYPASVSLANRSKMTEANRNVPKVGMLDPDFEHYFKECLPQMRALQAVEDIREKIYDRDGHFMYGWIYDNISVPLMPFVKQAVPIMRDFKIRAEDVFICAFPSSVSLAKRSKMAEPNRNVPKVGMLDPGFERHFKECVFQMRALRAVEDSDEKVYDRDGHFMYGWIYDNISVPLMPPIKQAVPIMRDFKIRDEDVFICAFPSSGTHWFWEMVCMLFNRKAEYLTGTKEQDMMEFLLPEIFEKRPSPRVLNTHLRPKYLPEKMVKEGKVILIVRNPKDVVVSNYRQTYGLKVLGYEGSFPSFYEMFLEGKIHYGSWFDYINEWMEAKENNPNLMIVSYEEAKKDLPALLSRLSKYLDLENDEDLFQKIAELCSFNSMKANKENAIGQLDIWKKDSGFFRSGKSGTWKNWLTVEQNERMDESLEIKLKSSEISKMYKTS